MNARKVTVVALLAVIATLFVLGMNAWQRRVQTAQDEQVRAEATRLVRMHSPVIGPPSAPVTIVEFFDPACETCRAFHPIVKDILAQYPTQVKLVIRYAPFHQGSDQVVKLLEAARRQNRYVEVLEAVLKAQPIWADHGQPRPELAWSAAVDVGLDLATARADAQRPEVDAALRQDIEDLTALQVTRTPTFFVNGRSLPSFGPEQLLTLVSEEVKKASP
jgi:protein-disulfide isomerase